jgi:hypothetical protein
MGISEQFYGTRVLLPISPSYFAEYLLISDVGISSRGHRNSLNPNLILIVKFFEALDQYALSGNAWSRCDVILDLFTQRR